MSEEHNYVEVNLKNPKEMVDLMGKKIFKNIAEEFFGCSDNFQHDYKNYDFTMAFSDLEFLLKNET
jgi:hypothetical protein